MAVKKTGVEKSAAAEAVEAEALDKPIEIEFDGEVYVIPPPLDLPLEILEANDELTFVRLILGDEQYARFRSKPRKIRDLQRLGEALNKAVFGDSGNSD